MTTAIKPTTVDLFRPGRPLDEDGISGIWDDLPVVPPDGIPLIRSMDEKQIGIIRNFTFVPASVITVEAVITDENILAQPWLNVDQIIRAAVLFTLGRRP